MPTQRKLLLVLINGGVAALVSILAAFIAGSSAALQSANTYVNAAYSFAAVGGVTAIWLFTTGSSMTERQIRYTEMMMWYGVAILGVLFLVNFLANRYDKSY